MMNNKTYIRMKQCIVILFISIYVIHLRAQERRKLSINECVMYAVNHNPRINIHKQNNNIYYEHYLEAIGRLLPTINASSSVNFNFGRNVDSETNNYIDNNSFSNNYGVYSSLLLFNGLINYRQIQISHINRLKGKKELEDLKDMIAYETIEAYYNVSYNMDIVAVAEEQLVESTKNAHKITRMLELGLKNKEDVAEAELKLAEDTYNLTKYRNLFIISIIQLKEKMNFPIEENLMIEDTDSDILVIKVTDTPIQIYNEAVKYNPKVQIAQSNVKSLELLYKISKGTLLPSISLDAGISTNFFRYMDGSPYSSFNRQFKDKRGEYITIRLNIPIFSGFSRSSSIKRAKAEMYISRNERDEVSRKLYNDIEQAIADVNGSVDEYYQAVKQKEAATIAHQINIRKYQEGIIDPILLQTSSNRLLKVKVEEYKAKYLYFLKYRLVNYYKGEALFME